MLKKVMAGLTMATAVACSSCESQKTSYARAEEYMANKPKREFLEVTNNQSFLTTDPEFKDYQRTQSKLDSVAFRDVFVTTQGAKDSSTVSEFNKLAAKNRLQGFSDRSKLLKTDITTKDYNKVLKTASKMDHAAIYAEYIQYATDSISYKKFFKDHNLLNDSTLSKFNKVCKQIKPKPII